MAEDLLFATLTHDEGHRAAGRREGDPVRHRRFHLRSADALVAAFRATLEEVTEADVILHVRDIANPESAAQKRQVEQILHDLGVIDEEDGEAQVPILELWNKWDLLDDGRREELAAQAVMDHDVLPISAVTGFGVEPMLDHVGRLLTKGARVHRITVEASDGARLAWLHAHGEVLDERDAGEGEAGPLRRLDVRLTDKEFGRFAALTLDRFGGAPMLRAMLPGIETGYEAEFDFPSFRGVAPRPYLLAACRARAALTLAICCGKPATSAHRSNTATSSRADLTAMRRTRPQSSGGCGKRCWSDAPRRTGCSV